MEVFAHVSNLKPLNDVLDFIYNLEFIDFIASAVSYQNYVLWRKASLDKETSSSLSAFIAPSAKRTNAYPSPSSSSTHRTWYWSSFSSFELP